MSGWLWGGWRPREQPAADETTADETTADVIAEVDESLQARLWLKAILPVLQLRTQESDTGGLPGACSGRVQFAFDRMMVAACERASRILRSDVSGDHADGL